MSKNKVIKIFDYETYDKVKDRNLSIKHISDKEKWCVSFAPQATIQHPLEYTIPLYFTLFGFDNEHMLNFNPSLPLRGQFLEAQKEGDGEKLKSTIRAFKTKLNGLIFLHALTMTCMAPVDYSNDDEILEDGKQLQETLDQFQTYRQFDPKLKLILMSRRPFSTMLADIKSKSSLNFSYYQKFLELMESNLSFREVRRLFSKTNYAEQYFKNHKAQDLTFLCKFFTGNFLKENQEIVEKLLTQGIVSTTMLRNFKNNIKINSKTSVCDLFNSYCLLALGTVEQPKINIKINLNVQSCEEIDTQEDIYDLVTSVDHPYDLLSPPPLLHADNSMGSYKDETKIEKKYGEAIIEVRGIRRVKNWFLKRYKLEQDEGVFLKYLKRPQEEQKPISLLEEYSLTLFDHLSKFTAMGFDYIDSKEMGDYSIFEAGFSYALRHGGH